MCESKKERWGGNDGARASHHLCGFSGPRRSAFPLTPARESLASIRGFLNHRWRLQVLHIKLIHQVSHRKKRGKWQQQREVLTCDSAEHAEDYEAYARGMKKSVKSSGLTDPPQLLPKKHHICKTWHSPLQIMSLTHHITHSLQLLHKAISGPAHINIVWNHKTNGEATHSLQVWSTDTRLLKCAPSCDSMINDQSPTSSPSAEDGLEWCGSKTHPQTPLFNLTKQA